MIGHKKHMVLVLYKPSGKIVRISFAEDFTRKLICVCEYGLVVTKMMTKKHFIELAQILKEHNASEDMVKDVANFCAKDNPNFNFLKFMEAALGITLT